MKKSPKEKMDVESIRTVSFDTCSMLKQQWIPEDVVGKGTYGVVTRACRKKMEANCPYVVKSQIIDSENVEETENEIIISLKLQDVKFNKMSITPIMHDAWKCYSPLSKQWNYYIAMEKWSGDVSKLARARDGGNFDYYLSELKLMFCLAIRLGMAGVIHGDLKSDQYLYEAHGNIVSDPQLKMVITDFGFSGLIGNKLPARLGWTLDKKKYKCTQAYTPLQYCQAAGEPCLNIKGITDPVYLNVLQLEMQFVGFSTVMVKDDVTGKVGVFHGLSEEFNRDLPSNTICSGYTNHVVQQIFLQATNHGKFRSFELPFQSMVDEVKRLS